MIRFNDYEEEDNLGLFSVPKKKKPESQFRGIWFPAVLCNMIEDGQISAQEAYVVATIDRFVSAKGEGCWAANDRLGKHCGVSGERMRAIIRKLVGMGILIRKPSSKHDRLLETFYSRSSPKKRKPKDAG